MFVNQRFQKEAILGKRGQQDDEERISNLWECRFGGHVRRHFRFDRDDVCADNEKTGSGEARTRREACRKARGEYGGAEGDHDRISERQSAALNDDYAAFRSEREPEDTDYDGTRWVGTLHRQPGQLVADLCLFLAENPAGHNAEQDGDQIPCPARLHGAHSEERERGAHPRQRQGE